MHLSDDEIRRTNIGADSQPRNPVTLKPCNLNKSPAFSCSRA
jgi:hypothetical protein